MGDIGTDPAAEQPPEPTPPPGPEPSDRVDPARARIRQVVVHYVPIVTWLPAYPADWRRADMVAALTSWGVMVPVAMAYAALAGVPPEYGLITAFAALTAYAIFGTSRHLKITTSSTMAIMSAAVVGPLAGGDADRYLALTAGLALVVGAILLVAGIVRLGFIADFLSKSVVTGFIFGLAITIIIGQLPKLLGVPSGGDGTIEQVQVLVDNLPDTNPWTLAVGVGALALILVLRRISRKIPGPLVALVLGIIAVEAFDLKVHGVSVVGEIQTGIPIPGLPNISLLDLPVPGRGRGRHRLPRRRGIARGRPGVRGAAQVRDRRRPGARRARRGEPLDGAVRRLHRGCQPLSVGHRRVGGHPLAALLDRHGGARPRDGRCSWPPCSRTCRTRSSAPSSSRRS